MTERSPQTNQNKEPRRFQYSEEQLAMMRLAIQEAEEDAAQAARDAEEQRIAQEILEKKRQEEDAREQRRLMIQAALLADGTSLTLKSEAPAFVKENPEPVEPVFQPKPVFEFNSEAHFSDPHEPAVAPPVEEWATDEEDVPEKIIHRNITVDNRQVHFDDTVPPEQRRLIVESAKNAGQDVEFNLVDPKYDYTAFRPEHVDELNNRLAQEESESNTNETGYQTSGSVIVPMHGEEAPMESHRFRNAFNKLNFKENKLKKIAIASSVGAAAIAVVAGSWIAGNDGSSDATGDIKEAIDSANSPEIDVSNMITACVEGEMGQEVHTQLVDVQGDVIWNVPNMEEGGAARPLNKLILDPKDHDGNPDTPDVAPVARYPKLTAPALELTTAVCAPEGSESIEVKGNEVHVDLANLQSQIAFESTVPEKLNVEIVPELILNAGVSQGVFSEEAKAAMFADMQSPEVRLSIIQDALMDVGSKLINVEGVPANQPSIEDAIKAGLPDTLLASLPQTPEGEPYKIVLNNNFSSPTSYVGIDGAVEGKYSLVNVDFVNQEADKEE